MSVNISNHASIRMQQRGISAEILEYLHQFGTMTHDGHGALLLTFGKKSKCMLRRALDQKKYACIESKLNAYAVMSNEGLVITVGYKQHRFHH